MHSHWGLPLPALAASIDLVQYHDHSARQEWSVFHTSVHHVFYRTRKVKRVKGSFASRRIRHIELHALAEPELLSTHTTAVCI